MTAATLHARTRALIDDDKAGGLRQSTAEAVADVVEHVVVPRLLEHHAPLQTGDVLVPGRVMRGHARGRRRPAVRY